MGINTEPGCTPHEPSRHTPGQLRIMTMAGACCAQGMFAITMRTERRDTPKLAQRAYFDSYLCSQYGPTSVVRKARILHALIWLQNLHHKLDRQQPKHQACNDHR